MSKKDSKSKVIQDIVESTFLIFDDVSFNKETNEDHIIYMLYCESPHKDDRNFFELNYLIIIIFRYLRKCLPCYMYNIIESSRSSNLIRFKFKVNL